MSDILLLTDDLEALYRLTGGPLPGLRVAVPAGIDSSVLLCRDETGKDLRVNYPEAPVLGFARAGANAQLASAVAVWWLGKCGDVLEVFPPENAPLPDRAELFHWLFTRMGTIAKQCAGLSVAMGAQNRELRNNYMFLQRRFANL